MFKFKIQGVQSHITKYNYETICTSIEGFHGLKSEFYNWFDSISPDHAPDEFWDEFWDSGAVEVGDYVISYEFVNTLAV